MSAYVKISGSWRQIQNTYVKVSGTWRKVRNIYTRVNGVWKPAYSYSWNIGAWSACSASCGGGTQSRSVVCQRNDGVNVTDDLCSSKPATTQACNTQACTSCYGLQGTGYACWQGGHNGGAGSYFVCDIGRGAYAYYWNGYIGMSYGYTPLYTGGYQYYAQQQMPWGYTWVYSVCRSPV